MKYEYLVGLRLEWKGQIHDFDLKITAKNDAEAYAMSAKEFHEAEPSWKTDGNDRVVITVNIGNQSAVFLADFDPKTETPEDAFQRFASGAKSVHLEIKEKRRIYEN